MQITNYTPIVLCGGDINYSHLPIGAHRSNAMIPVNGRPVIGWIFNDLEKKGFREAVVVLQFENQKLFNYLNWTYASRMNLHFAYVQPGGTILHSLLAGLSWVMPGKGTYVILGDTLIEDDLPPDKDFVYTGPYDEPENWCLAQEDENQMLKKLYDKQSNVPKGLSALAGVYVFSQADALRNIVVQQIQAQHKELSSALAAYNDINKLRVLPAVKWYDFGHIGGFNKASQTLLQSRYFNSLSIDPVRGTITKRSQKNEKLADELNWYNMLPEELKVFTPRILSNEIDNGTVEIVQEYYGYPNLAELFVFGDLDFSVWKHILQQLMEVHRQFCRFSINLQSEDLKAMYRGKTFERLAALEKDPEWSDLLKQEKLLVNGVELMNLPMLLTPLDKAINNLIHQETKGTVVHGDYCFSNILYDLKKQIIRLIDPRGSFGQKGIYGDPRYDMAKLRHSVNGLYDFIIADLFNVEKDGNHVYKFEIYQPEKREMLSHWLDNLLMVNGYKLEEIILIEALLFISMVPYHAEKSNRQLAMYLTGIKILNQLFFNSTCDSKSSSKKSTIVC